MNNGGYLELFQCSNPNCERLFFVYELPGNRVIPEHNLPGTEYLCCGSFQMGRKAEIPEKRVIQPTKLLSP